MELYSHEISGLKDILNELNENIADYEKRKETGNSQGEHKDIYRGKFEAYSRCRTLLYRYLKWHSIIEVMSDGNYHFLKNGKLPIPHVSGSDIIADFMGVKEKESTFESYGKPKPFWYSVYLAYRTPAFSTPGKSLEHLLNENKFLHSWDWLLPVYRKIRDIINDRAKLDKHTRTKGDLLELDAQMAICAVDIQKAFESIVAFIKWYNASLADR